MKRKTYGYSTILIFALSAACVSCAITDEFFQTQDNRKAETILATLPDCVTAYNPWAAAGTKSSGESTLAVSKDDLDFEKMEIREDSLRLYYQIPVKDYGFPQELIIRFLQIEPENFPLSEAESRRHSCCTVRTKTDLTHTRSLPQSCPSPSTCTMTLSPVSTISTSRV